MSQQADYIDSYQVLGVSPKAPLSEVREARRQKLKALHESLMSAEPDAIVAIESAMKSVQSAYVAISQPTLNDQIDALTHAYQKLGLPMLSSPDDARKARNEALAKLKQRVDTDCSDTGVPPEQAYSELQHAYFTVTQIYPRITTANLVTGNKL